MIAAILFTSYFIIADYREYSKIEKAKKEKEFFKKIEGFRI